MNSGRRGSGENPQRSSSPDTSLTAEETETRGRSDIESYRSYLPGINLPKTLGDEGQRRGGVGGYTEGSNRWLLTAGDKAEKSVYYKTMKDLKNKT